MCKKLMETWRPLTKCVHAVESWLSNMTFYLVHMGRRRWGSRALDDYILNLKIEVARGVSEFCTVVGAVWSFSLSPLAILVEVLQKLRLARL